ncbi:MAG TPA: type VI secretion system baseplate subunit TssF [Steroidobacteraceae bacterium]|nr:type VI secretion system baseplate subunit TssF [Steroidobacteraceae bacterium]
MDPRLLEYYNRELLFMREMGAEFAQTYPRIAARLGIDGIECADPYVERLLEGVAWLAARVQLKIDARHPEFTQHLLEMVYPQFLSPMPSCALAEFVPDLKDTALEAGVTIPRGSSLQTQMARGERTACQFRTAQDVTLWPLTVTEAKYISGSGALSTQGLAVDSRVRAAIRLRFKVSPGIKLSSLPLDALTIYIKSTPDIASKLHEQVLANCLGFWTRSLQPGASVHFRPATAVEPVGLTDDEALLPVTKLAFQGYRLLREYFAFPERFLYFKLGALKDAIATFEGDEFEIYIGLDRIQASLENALDASQFRLFTAPVINLFAKESDRIHVTPFDVEQHVLPDRNRPMDFEVFSIEKITGVGAGGETQAEIAPFYNVNHRTASSAERSYYTVQRRQRLYSNRQEQSGARASYIGTECFVSVVDSHNRQWTGDFRQLDVQTLCTNRDLPIQISMGKGKTDFVLDGAAPLEAIRCINGPTYPRPSPAFGDTAWKLISHLTLNYLSLADTNPQSGAELLREMLSLYSDANDVAMNRQIDGVRNIAHRAVVRRIPIKGPISYGRGLEIDITMDDNAFEGTGILLLGAVLERFFPRYVSLNSFTQMRLFSQKRGEVKSWPVRLGNRQIL